MKTHTGYDPGKTYCRVAQAKSGACVCVMAEQEAADSRTRVGPLRDTNRFCSGLQAAPVPLAAKDCE